MEEMVRAEEIHREEDAPREIHREENTQGGAGRSAPARGAPQLSPLTRSPRPRPGRPRTLPHRRELRHRPCPCRAWARDRCSSTRWRTAAGCAAVAATAAATAAVAQVLPASATEAESAAH